MRRVSVAVLGLFVLSLAVAVPVLSQGKTCADCLWDLNNAPESEFSSRVHGVGPDFAKVLAIADFRAAPCDRRAIISAVAAVQTDKARSVGTGLAEIIVWKFCPWLFCEACGEPPACPPCPSCTVESLFVSPSVDRGIEARLISILNAATRTVDLALYSFTDDQLGDAVIRAHQRGVAVRLILDDGQEGSADGREHARIVAAGIEVVVEQVTGLMHHKFLVVDGTITVTGSYNWSDAADRSNFENVVVMVCPEVAASFAGEFNRLWNALKAGQTP